MRLFFETGAQAHHFLLCTLLGLLTAFCLDGSGKHFFLKLFQDLMVLGCCGIALTLLTSAVGGETLRIYHWLGLFSGAVLYLSGLGRLKRKVYQSAQSLLLKFTTCSRKKCCARRTNIQTSGKDDA